MRELERDRGAPADRASPFLDACRLAVVGNGRVGGSVVHAARQAGLQVTAWSRGDLRRAASAAEIVLLCVPDRAIGHVCAELMEIDRGRPLDLPKYVGHVSGAHGLDVLSPARDRGAQTFSVHPLQTIPRAPTDLKGVPCAVSGTPATATRAGLDVAPPSGLAVAYALAERLGMRAFEVPDDARAAYHAAASMASNFLITLEEAAADLLRRVGVADPRATLAPLVLRTAANWAQDGAAALTGPIARGDDETVSHHLDALMRLAPELRPLYEELADHTRRVAQRSRDPQTHSHSRTEGATPVADQSTRDTAGHQATVVRTRDELRTALGPARRAGRRIGLVPTMGALHEGHLSLLRAARQQCDVVVMSLFVNPTQFGPNEDLAAYPRDEARDVRLASECGVDVVYAPDATHVYPEGYATFVEVGGGLTDVLCGDPSRRGPGHFRGVATVVTKLFNAVGPDVAYFGQKDAQQALVIKRMVRDLEFPIEIVVLPTVREPDGLAMSSRNAYLEPAERARATALHRALRAVEDAVHAGQTDVDTALAAGHKVLAEAGIEPEYLEARDAADLSPRDSFTGRPTLVAVAARVGKARLIDNIVVSSDTSREDT
ncbi:MAG TPA: pantoate--beta-alanine ligase [Actinopolymorphaceae bacterium]